jgi:predicted dehydrogenase
MLRTATFLLLMALPMAAQEYKIAVIGLVHSHVWGHLTVMLKQQHAKLVGIAETNPELIAEAKRRGATEVPFFDDYKKMLDQAKPDIAWAFVENNRHLEMVQACAPRKVHVIFEKPLASTYQDAMAIERLARQHNIQVMTNYQMAWWPANYAAKQQADSGALGEVWRVRGVVGHGGPGSSGVGRFFFAWLTDPVKNGAGALVDFGCYNALWAYWYMGRPDTVYAQVNRLQPEKFPKVEDNSIIVLNYKKGAAILEGSWDLPRSFQDLEVFGRKGSVHLREGKVELRKGQEAAQEIELPALPPERSAPIAYMVSCLKSGQPLQGLVSLEMNLPVNEVMEAAKMSIQSGRAIKLPLAVGQTGRK